MKKQILTAIVVNLLSVLYGISMGWAAPNTVLFQSEASPIGVMTSSQISLIASMLCIGATVGTILFGFCADFLGRKRSLLLIGLPQLAANVLLLIGDNYIYIYAARFLFGLAGGGCYVMVPMFVSEISHESIRGALGSAMAICVNLGVVIGYVLTSWMDYGHVPYIPIVMTCVYMLIFMWLPESPDYLAHLNRMEEAKKAYQFYGNTRVNPGESGPEAESGQVEDQEKSTKVTLQDFKNVAVMKGIIISFILIIFVDTAGILAILSFITELFDWASIELDVYVATIVVGVIQVVGAIISTIFVDRFGRRILLIFSCVGTAICFYALGIYFYLLPKPEYKDLVDQLQWLPLVSISAAILVAAAGILTLPFFLLTELLPVKVRGTVSSISLTLSWMFAFLTIQFYHTMVEYFTIAGTIWIYATSCVVEIFFVYFCLPETKNLTIDEIQQRLRKGV